MNNWIESFIEFLTRFWPMEIVDHWEEGVFYSFGTARPGTLPRGLYWFWPWFQNINTVSVVPDPVSSPLLNVTLIGGEQLTYSVTAILQVTNAWTR